MALPNWQQLQKNIDDPETIEQAIIRLVNSHEEDPEAHLGVGESLEQHKTQSVIDHPAQSIVPDKISGKGIYLYYNFYPLSQYDIIGDVRSEKSSGVGLYPDFSVGDIAEILAMGTQTERDSITIGDFLVDINFFCEFDTHEPSQNSYGTFYTGIGDRDFSDLAAGFFLENGVFRCFINYSANRIYSDPIPNLLIGRYYNLRIFYDFEAEKVIFYINGQVVQVFENVVLENYMGHFVFHLEKDPDEYVSARLFSCVVNSDKIALDF